jgi:hypothetical protein
VTGPRPGSRPVPWRLGDLLGLWLACSLGAVARLVSWWGASGTAVVTREYAWTVLGIGGAVFVGCGNGLWILSGRRAVGERRRHVLAALDASLPVPATDTEVPHVSNDPVAATGMSRYHRPDCQLVAGKAVAHEPPEVHERHGRRPCGICAP